MGCTRTVHCLERRWLDEDDDDEDESEALAESEEDDEGDGDEVDPIRMACPSKLPNVNCGQHVCNAAEITGSCKNVPCSGRPNTWMLRCPVSRVKGELT